MTATDRPVGWEYGRRYGLRRSNMTTNPTENDALLVDRHASTYVRIEGGGERRRTAMKWLSVAAVVGLMALARIKTGSSVTREDATDTTVVLQADGTEADCLAQAEVRERHTCCTLTAVISVALRAES